MRKLFAAVVTAALLTAGTAIGAPDKTLTLSAATPEHSWDGEQGQYTNLQYSEDTCSKDAATYCEIFLLDIRSDTPVTLDASLTDFSSPIADFDLRIYMSDSTGAFGDQLDSPEFAPDDPAAPGWGGPPGVDEFYHVEGVAPGYYLLVVSHFFNPNATYKGNVKVTGATGGGTTPPPPPDGGGTTPPPTGGGDTGSPAPAPEAGPLPFKVPSTLGSAKKVKKKKALTFKATASEAIDNLRVSLVDSKKKVVARTSVASFPKGSKTLKLKVRRLKAGRYSLVSEGDVNGQHRVQSQAVRIKK